MSPLRCRLKFSESIYAMTQKRRMTLTIIVCSSIGKIALRWSQMNSTTISQVRHLTKRCKHSLTEKLSLLTHLILALWHAIHLLCLPRVQELNACLAKVSEWHHDPVHIYKQSRFEKQCFIKTFLFETETH